MTVAAVLRQKGASVISVPPEATVAEAAEIISRRRIGAVVVCDAGGRLVGIFSERDVVRGLTQHGAALMAMPVSALMTQQVQVVPPPARWARRWRSWTPAISATCRWWTPRSA